jgi:hypothetical protein
MRARAGRPARRGVTVLLARVVLGERLRWVQRVGLGLAAIGEPFADPF